MNRNNRAIVNMTNWSLYMYKEVYSLKGVVDNHPKLGKNVFVEASSMLDFKYEDEILFYKTYNTNYICPLKYLTTEPYGNEYIEYVKELASLSDKSDSMLDKIIAVTAKQALGYISGDDFFNRIVELQDEGQEEIKKMRENEENRLIAQASLYQDSVYIEVSNILAGNQLAYNIQGMEGVVYSTLHGGIFKDSVLYIKHPTDETPFVLDFRYMPKGGKLIDCYAISKNIRRIVIKNEGVMGLKFKQLGNEEVEIPVGETVCIIRQTLSEKGLWKYSYQEQVEELAIEIIRYLKDDKKIKSLEQNYGEGRTRVVKRLFEMIKADPKNEIFREELLRAEKDFIAFYNDEQGALSEEELRKYWCAFIS